MTWIQKIPLMLKGIMIFEEANKQNMFEQHADKPDVHCQPPANLPGKLRATLR